MASPFLPSTRKHGPCRRVPPQETAPNDHCARTTRDAPSPVWSAGELGAFIPRCHPCSPAFEPVRQSNARCSGFTRGPTSLTSGDGGQQNGEPFSRPSITHACECAGREALPASVHSTKRHATQKSRRKAVRYDLHCLGSGHAAVRRLRER